MNEAFDAWWRSLHGPTGGNMYDRTRAYEAWAAATLAERERCAKVAERTATLCEQRAGVEPERLRYSKTYAQADRDAAAELRDVALLIREGTR